jgi:hypothetical protein
MSRNITFVLMYHHHKLLDLINIFRICYFVFMIHRIHLKRNISFVNRKQLSQTDDEM